jgi:hypothetical protein
MAGETLKTIIVPIASGVALTTANIPILAANLTRRGVSFHNRSSSLTVEIAIQPTVAGAVGSIIILPGAWLDFTDAKRANCGFNGHMVSGSGDITILEWI